MLFDRIDLNAGHPIIVEEGQKDIRPLFQFLPVGFFVGVKRHALARCVLLYPNDLSVHLLFPNNLSPSFAGGLLTLKVLSPPQR